LQQDLRAILEGNWKMRFHPKMSVTRSKNPIKFHYTLYGHSLESLGDVKYLDLTIRQYFKWKSA